ncbi:hypothetical protein MYX07_00685 [Patescibacteria group bacterium AH-259-L07]|nr:hypothetical protein [Patescibacteria group bacterium AH-259-L07]
MMEKYPTFENNPEDKEDKRGKIPESLKVEATTEEGKKIEGELFLSEKQVAEYLAEHESMQREMLGGKEHLVLRGMSVKRAQELMDAMGTRGLTVEELAEAMVHDAGFAKRAKEQVKALMSAEEGLEKT